MRTISILVIAASALPAQGTSTTTNKHVVVYREAGRYGGWPANHGIWSWGNEILVGFEAGYFRNNERGHAIDYSRPAEHVLARSKDGGETWAIERPAALKPPASVKVAGVPTGEGGKEPTDCPGGIDFKNRDFILTARMGDIHVGPSRFYYSSDRGHSWNGPCNISNFGQKGIAARTDYLVNGKHEITMFLTAAKSNGKEGRVIATRTTDGAKSWNMLSFIGPEPDETDFAIMPSSVRLGANTIVTAIRHRHFIDLYRTDDDGKSWTFVTKPVPNTGRGNPPSMIQLKDGRLALTYGFRDVPYSIRARASRDEGKTWSEDRTLRSDGGNWDLGYTRSVQRPDGKVVTVYYFNDAADRERYIAATIWQP
jgi:hypothetical protein